MGRREAVAVGEAFDGRGRQPGKDVLQREVEQVITQSVDALETAEQKDHALDVAHVELLVERVKRMRDGVREVFSGEVALQVEDVLAHSGDVAVLGLGEIPHEDVDFATVLGEIGGDFLAQKHARQVSDFQRAAERVVVGERDEIHAPRAERVVEHAGAGIAVGEVKAPEHPVGRAGAVAGVQMEISLHGSRRRMLSHRADANVKLPFPAASIVAALS